MPKGKIEVGDFFIDKTNNIILALFDNKDNHWKCLRFNKQFRNYDETLEHVNNLYSYTFTGNLF